MAEDDPTSRRPMALALALVALAYLRVASLELVWDDDLLTSNNPFLQTWGGLVELWTHDAFTASGLGEATAYYRPVPMTTFWLTARVSNGAVAHHLVNVVIHVANVALLGAVLQRRLMAGPRLAALLAAFWGLATVNSEAVLWVAGRFDLVVTTFALGAFLANGTARRGLTHGLALGALLSKEPALLWLGVLALDDWLILKRERRQWLRRAAAHGLMGVGYLLVRKAIGIETLIDPATVIPQAPGRFVEMMGHAVGRLFVPIGLDPFEPVAPPPLPLVALVLVALVGLAGWGLRKAKEEPAAATLVVAGAWLGAVCLPVVAIPGSTPLIGDRYGYLANVGVVLALVVVAQRGLGDRRRRVGMAFGAFIAAQAALLQLRIPEWQSRASIAEATLEVHPDNWYAAYLVGIVRFEAGQLDEADAFIQRSLTLAPNWRAFNASCVIRLRQGRLDEAERDCQRSAAIHEANPRVWVNLSSVAHRAHAWPRALQRAQTAISIDPDNVEAHYLAAVAALNLGRVDDAVAHCRAGLKSAPEHAELQRLAKALEQRTGEPVR